MIKIRQHTPTQLKLYSPKDEFIGFINNAVEALNVRLDIALSKLEGYYFVYGSIKIDINIDGEVTNWPEELYKETLNLCIILNQIQKIKIVGKEA